MALAISVERAVFGPGFAAAWPGTAADVARALGFGKVFESVFVVAAMRLRGQRAEVAREGRILGARAVR